MSLKICSTCSWIDTDSLYTDVHGKDRGECTHKEVNAMFAYDYPPSPYTDFCCNRWESWTLTYMEKPSG